MTFNLTDPIFTDADKAREHLEAQRWPDGPYCPHCGNVDQRRIAKMEGTAHRPGLYNCRECRKQFSVTVGTVFERSKIPLNQWLLATYLLASSKKGMSAHQLHRMLGVTYKTAWFMEHRIREAMREGTDGYKASPKGGLGGKNKVVEADETFVGGKAKNRAFRKPAKKEAVVSLVEREGKVRSFHVANVTSKTLKPILYTQIDRASYLMTDEAPVYGKIGRQFGGHGTVNHSIKEYVRTGGFHHTNTVENYFSIFKRGIVGTYHHVSEAHLKRYLAEFDFRHNERAGLGVDDAERANKALKGISGKRLTYRSPNQSAHA
ncbi:MAG: IS1595 family transposase [Parvularculaceae bacterium]